MRLEWNGASTQKRVNMTSFNKVNMIRFDSIRLDWRRQFLHQAQPNMFRGKFGIMATDCPKASSVFVPR